jgi:protein-S-isoprenylcysteine O-methyltransferase Ste14
MKKSIIMVYSLLAYLAGVIALLYVIGFVGNFVVHKSIDSGSETGFTRALLINTALVLLFALQHSIMARPAFKEWWVGIAGPAAERSTYVLLTSVALLLLCWQWQPMPMLIWKIENTHVIVILTGVYFFGWLIVFLSTFMINHFELFGLKQAFENLAGQHPVATTFKTNYFYTIVRHPIMLGLFIAFWASPLMTLGHFVFSITTTIYIFIAVKFLEEKDLRKYFGKEYEAYQKKVPMVIPFSGKRNNLSKY